MDPTTPAPRATPDPNEPALRLRRRSLLAAVGLVVPVALVGCGKDDEKGDDAKLDDSTPVELSFFWWGGKARAEITQKVLDLYTKRHPNVTFKTTWQANQGYYDKLSTLAAGGNAPDIFQLDDNGLSDYTLRRVTLDLKKYVGKQIKVDKFPKSMQTAGEVKGRFGGIPAAENTPAMFYDKTVLDQLGVALPKVDMSWDDLVTLGVDVYTKSGGKTNGTMDPSADYKALQVWLRQQGKDLYTEDGKLGFAADDVQKWLQFWADAAAKHATPPADILHTANAGDVTKQLVTTKNGVTSFMWSNQLEEIKKSTDHEIGLVTYPGDPKGAWARASMYWAASARTKHAARVVDVINFLVNDADAGTILGAERGLAPNLDIRKQVAPTLTQNMQISAEFESGLADKFGPKPPAPPKGHSQVKTLLVQAAESVQYKKANPQQAASQFVEQAKNAIGE